MVRTVGIGVIGMGWMGQVHSRSYLELRHRFQESDIRPRLVICADDAEDRALAGHERFGFERYTTDWREVVADPDVDAVNITAPMNVHLDAIRAAAEAGKHILCEKPVGRDPDETAEAEKVAREAGVITRVGFNYRLAPLVQYLRGLIRDGRLGDMTHYDGRFFVGYGSDPRTVLSWRFDRELAGLGTLGDLMSHLIDMTLMLAGPVTRVVAKQRTTIPQRPLIAPGEGSHFTTSDSDVKGEVTNDDSVWALVEFANGAYGTLEGSRVIRGARNSLSFDLHGTEGAASWDFLRMNELELFVPDDESGVHDGHTRIRSGEEHPFQADFYPGNSQGLAFEDLKAIEAFQFLSSVVEGRQGEPGFAEALAVAGVQDAIVRSWESDSWEDVRSLRRD